VARRARGALARRGEHLAAVELARTAVDLAAATDALLDHADARVALATALRAAGRADDAAIEQRRAVELWEAKGATLLAPDGAEASAVGRRTAGPAARAPECRDRERAALDAAVAARDEAAIVAQVSDEAEVVDHPTGVTYGREGILASAACCSRAAT
jgi:hypothetical protein